MSHTHNHPEGLHCSCCNPMWKALIPGNQFEITEKQGQENEPVETLIFLACSNPEDEGDHEVGYIQTMEGGKDVMVEAMGIANGKIVATGSFDHVMEKMPEDTPVEPVYGGRTLLPGLFEPHLHILPTAVFNMAIDVGPFQGQYLRSGFPGQEYTREWVIETLRNAAGSTNDNGWIFGRNVDPALLLGPDKEFDSEALDKVSETQPVFLMNSSMHFAYINTVAIELAEAEGGEVPEDGVLKEAEEITPVLNLMINSMDPENFATQLSDQVDDIFKDANKRGATYLMDAALGPGTDGLNEVEYLRLKANDMCRVRIGAALIVFSPDEFNDNIKGKYFPNRGDENFNIAYVKVVSDGSNQGLTGYQKKPYDCDDNYNVYGGPDTNISQQTNEGIFNYGYPIEFDALISTIVDNGWPLMIHANGDEAMDRTIDAFRNAGINAATKEVRRDRIEHASLLSDKNMADMEKLGISPSFLIGHVGYWGWVFQQTILGQERSDQLDRCHSAIEDYHMRITLHSDYSVSPLGPLRLMEQSITRRMEGAPEQLGPQVLNGVERITRFQALKAVTYDAAWQCHADQWVGSLEVGKCADFTILNENPLTYSSKNVKGYSASGMRDIPVLETWKGGRKVYGD